MPTATTPVLPRPAIHIDGVLNPSLTTDLVGLTVDESLSAPAQCLARFSNLGASGGRATIYKYFDFHDVDFGRVLTVWQGLPPAPLFRMFEGLVYLIEGAYPTGAPPEFVVQAEDALRAFRMRQRTRIFEDMADAQIVQTIAGEHGLSVDIDLSSTLPVHARTAQLNQSDGAFLLDRVLAVGGEMWIEQNTLVLRDGAPPAEPAELVYGENLVSFAVRADARHQRTALGVSGWDFRAKQSLLEGASDSDLPPGLGSDASGGQVVAQAFDQAIEALVEAVPDNAGEARSLAIARYRRLSADFVTGQGLALYAPGLRAGRTVGLRGIGPLFSGAYQITRVRHRFDVGQGLRTEFDVRRTRIGRPGKTGRQESAHATRDPRGSRTPATRTRTRAAAGARPARRRSPRS